MRTWSMHCNIPTHQSSHGIRGGTWWKGHYRKPETQNRTSSSSVPSEEESEEELEDAKLELSDGITEAGRTAFGWDRRRRLRPPGTVDPVGISPASDKNEKNAGGAEQAPQSTNSGPDGLIKSDRRKSNRTEWKSNRTEQKTGPNLTGSVCVPLWSCHLFMCSKPRIKCNLKSKSSHLRHVERRTRPSLF